MKISISVEFFQPTPQEIFKSRLVMISGQYLFNIWPVSKTYISGSNQATPYNLCP